SAVSCWPPAKRNLAPVGFAGRTSAWGSDVALSLSHHPHAWQYQRCVSTPIWRGDEGRQPLQHHLETTTTKGPYDHGIYLYPAHPLDRHRHTRWLPGSRTLRRRCPRSRRLPVDGRVA